MQRFIFSLLSASPAYVFFFQKFLLSISGVMNLGHQGNFIQSSFQLYIVLFE